MRIRGAKPTDDFHKALGKIMWDKVGMSRNESGLKEAIEEIQDLREDFWNNVKVPGLVLSNENDLRRFLRSIKHIKMRNERNIEFSKENFILDNYREILKDYNVKFAF